jgi:hypothetical protein
VRQVLIAIWAVGAAGSWHAARADLPPSIQLEIGGSCPAEAQVRRSIGDLLPSTSTADSGWRLEVAPAGGGDLVAVRCLKPGGSLAFSRLLRDDDCAALADAIAIITAAYFTSLPRRPPSAPYPASAPTTRARVAAAPVRGVTHPTLVRRQHRKPDAKNSVRLSAGISGGIDVSPSPGSAVAAGQADVSLAPFRAPVVLRLVGSAGDVSEQTHGGERIELRGGAVRLDAGLRLARRRWWLQPMVGAGVSILGVATPDLPEAPSVTRVHGVVAMALAGGVRLLRDLSLRLELASVVYTSSDAYIVEPGGEVGESPWISLSALMGLEVDIFL